MQTSIYSIPELHIVNVLSANDSQRQVIDKTIDIFIKKQKVDKGDKKKSGEVDTTLYTHLQDARNIFRDQTGKHRKVEEFYTGLRTRWKKIIVDISRTHGDVQDVIDRIESVQDILSDNPPPVNLEYEGELPLSERNNSPVEHNSPDDQFLPSYYDDLADNMPSDISKCQEDSLNLEDDGRSQLGDYHDDGDGDDEDDEDYNERAEKEAWRKKIKYYKTLPSHFHKQSTTTENELDPDHRSQDIPTTPAPPKQQRNTIKNMINVPIMNEKRKSPGRKSEEDKPPKRVSLRNKDKRSNSY